MNSRENKLAIFIDSASLALASNGSGFVVDFKLLLKAFEHRGNLLRAVYLAAIDENQPVGPLHDWLEYNGYSVVTKNKGRFKLKGSINIELALARWRSLSTLMK